MFVVVVYISVSSRKAVKRIVCIYPFNEFSIVKSLFTTMRAEQLLRFPLVRVCNRPPTITRLASEVPYCFLTDLHRTGGPTNQLTNEYLVPFVIGATLCSIPDVKNIISPPFALIGVI